MKVVIRADASVVIGSGHVMRCLTLARALRVRGAEVTFVCRQHAGNYGNFIEEKGFIVMMIPGEEHFDPVRDADLTMASFTADTPDWLVVDHYEIDISWEKRLRAHVKGIMVIDDLANRSHDCDLLLDQNLYADPENRYQGLVPLTCRLLLGPRHALLRDEFLAVRKTMRVRDGILRRILVFFGSSDPTSETQKALKALSLLDRPDIGIDVVVGASNPHADEVRTFCASMPNVAYHYQADTMAELMANADLALGAGGATTWERCYLRLPSIVWIIADNQRETTETMAHAGAVQNLGEAAQVTVEGILNALTTAIASPAMLMAMGERCHELMGEAVGMESLVDMLCKAN